MKRISLLLFVTLAVGLSASAQDKRQEGQLGAERMARTLAFSLEGSGGYLGVRTRDVTSENFASFGLSSVRGVAVEEVVADSPAAKAGLQKGDVILRMNGDVVTSARKLNRLVGEVAPDHQVRLSVFRNGSEVELTATVGKRPGPVFGEGNFRVMAPDAPMPFEFEMPDLEGVPGIRAMPFPRGDGNVYVWGGLGGRRIGIGITPLTEQLARHFGVEDGVLIDNVTEGSPAANAGLRAGDIIVAVDGKNIESERDVIRGINAKTEGDVEITFVRQGSRQSVRVTPEKAKEGSFRIVTPPAPPAKAEPAPKPMVPRVYSGPVTR